MKTTLTLTALSACLLVLTGNWWYFALFAGGLAAGLRLLYLREMKKELDRD